MKQKQDKIRAELDKNADVPESNSREWLSLSEEIIKSEAGATDRTSLEVRPLSCLVPAYGVFDVACVCEVVVVGSVKSIWGSC